MFNKKDNLKTIEFNNSVQVPYLHFPKLDDTGLVKHCFTTKLGGVSQGYFESLNLSFTRGDDSSRVMENYSRLAQTLGCQIDDFVTTDQTHTTNVMRVDSSHRGIGVTKPRPYTDVDGLITKEPGLVLSTFYADCVPLYFVDPVNKAIGLSHSGWRGTVNKMGQATLDAMATEFNTKASDVIAAIGPSICQDCYEVSLDVAEEFAAAFPGYEDEIISPGINSSKKQLNLWRANELVLIQAGVNPDNIATTNICTCCNSDLLFSHRATNGKRGNLGAFMYLL